MKRIAVLGSTGSIGRQALEIVEKYPDRFKISALVAGSNAELLEKQINKFRPEIAGLYDAGKIASIKEIPQGTTLYTGENCTLHALENCDLALIAISGFAGLKPTLYAVKNGIDVALANKEALVAGGELVIAAAEKKGVNIIPVDSEHSAIFQCLGFDRKKKFKKLIITASGGAFRGRGREEIEKLKASDALKHPNWDMGRKITVDCATLMNKGLEVIEACRLFGVGLDKVKAILHPESVIHSMVEFDDGAIIAQMGYPSMKVPISLAFTYPERIDVGVQGLDLAGKSLNFGEIDRETFPCFSLALKAYEMGGIYPCVLSAANEEAVSLYLQDKIGFYGISDAVEYAVNKFGKAEADEKTLYAVDFEARRLIRERFDI